MALNGSPPSASPTVSYDTLSDSVDALIGRLQQSSSCPPLHQIHSSLHALDLWLGTHHSLDLRKTKL